MKRRALTLDDLSTLYQRYVPITSRHYNVDDYSLWWPAHELGHLLTVPSGAIGLPMFGLDYDADPDMFDVHERRCRELAAMSVSRRLLLACGRKDVADQEVDDTDHDTIEYAWEDHAKQRIAEILREHRCVRLPRTCEGLEAKLTAVTGGRGESPGRTAHAGRETVNL